MGTILNFLSHTPTYVYFVFFYLFVVGFQASKDRVVSIYKPVIILIVFWFLSISGITKLKLDYSYYILFLSVIIVSGYLGWRLVANKKILIDKKKRLIALPGSWTTLVLVLIIFSSKYYLGYKNSQDPCFIFSSGSRLLTIFTSGFSLGLISGRFINYMYRFNVDKSIELSKKT